MAGETVYRTGIAPEWIDYNGHLRDAYYGLIVSLATDALMDRLGMDAAYRARSGCTLYTLEMHLNFLREVKQDRIVLARVRLLGADRKRLHVAVELCCEGEEAPAAGAELMLLHVHQGDTVRAQAFSPEVTAAIEALGARTRDLEPAIPGSRRIALKSPQTP